MSDPTGQNPYGAGRGPQDGNQLPPFQPPGAPGGFGAPPPPPKKKRWPWILAGLFVLCFLPLGACAALLGFGVSELNKINDEVNGTVETMFVDASNEDYASAASVADSSGGCISFGQLEELLREVQPTGTPTIQSTQFVERDDGTTFSNFGLEDEESFVVDGRENSGAGEVLGIVSTSNGTQNFDVKLVQDARGWRVCEVTVS